MTEQETIALRLDIPRIISNLGGAARLSRKEISEMSSVSWSKLNNAMGRSTTAKFKIPERTRLADLHYDLCPHLHDERILR